MLSQDIRKQISEMYAETQNFRWVAEHFNVHPFTVKRVVKGLYVLEKEKRGPKVKISKNHEKVINKAIKVILEQGEKVTAARIQSDCNLSHISIRTIQRQLRRMRLGFEECNSMSKLDELACVSIARLFEERKAQGKETPEPMGNRLHQFTIFRELH